MKTIQQHKQEATLNKVFRFEEGTMSRKDWLKLKMVQGCNVEERTRRNYAAEEKLQNWLDREKREVPLGNLNYPTTKYYLEEKERLANGIYKTEYVLNESTGSGIFDITKTEYDYFNGLPKYAAETIEQNYDNFKKLIGTKHNGYDNFNNKHDNAEVTDVKYINQKLCVVIDDDYFMSMERFFDSFIQQHEKQIA